MASAAKASSASLAHSSLSELDRPLKLAVANTPDDSAVLDHVVIVGRNGAVEPRLRAASSATWGT
jgi:hypothetical protein